VIKNRYSAFAGTNLADMLKRSRVIDATGTPGTAHMGQREIRKAVADFHSAGFSRVNTTKQYLSRQRKRIYTPPRP